MPPTWPPAVSDAHRTSSAFGYRYTCRYGINNHISSETRKRYEAGRVPHCIVVTLPAGLAAFDSLLN